MDLQRILILALTGLGIGCAAATTRGAQAPVCEFQRIEPWPPMVSIIQLIASPDDYAGKRVQVVGYVRLEFEGMGIYMHEEDYRQGLYSNGLWLDFSGPSAERLCPSGEDLNNRYMIVQGVFSKGPGGHMGLWNGELTDISRFDRWR